MKNIKLSLSEIGRYFEQDHTTVLHSIEMKKDKRRFWGTHQTLWQEYQDIKETIS
jgi:chromosomal replication initiation ATPase DnaA